MSKTVVIAVVGVTAVALFLLWKSQPKATGETVASNNTVPPIGSAPVTSKSAQLQNQLVQVGAGLAANFLDGFSHETEPTGENGGVDTHNVQSTAPTTYLIS